MYIAWACFRNVSTQSHSTNVAILVGQLLNANLNYCMRRMSTRGIRKKNNVK